MQAKVYSLLYAVCPEKQLARFHAVGYYSSPVDQVSLNTPIGIWTDSHVYRLWRSEILSRAVIWSPVDINGKDYSTRALRVSFHASKNGLDIPSSDKSGVVEVQFSNWHKAAGLLETAVSTPFRDCFATAPHLRGHSQYR